VNEVRLHRHRGAPDLHLVTDRHVGASHWAHFAECRAWHGRQARGPGGMLRGPNNKPGGNPALTPKGRSFLGASP